MSSNTVFELSPDTQASLLLTSDSGSLKRYVVQAVSAVLDGKRIEDRVNGDVHGWDVCAGFEKDWVEMLDLNQLIAAEGTQEKMDRAIEQFKRGRLEVFRGDYLGVNPDDESDTYDLKKGYAENRDYSLPSFHYVLKDVILEIE